LSPRGSIHIPDFLCGSGFKPRDFSRLDDRIEIIAVYERNAVSRNAHFRKKSFESSTWKITPSVQLTFEYPIPPTILPRGTKSLLQVGHGTVEKIEVDTVTVFAYGFQVPAGHQKTLVVLVVGRIYDVYVLRRQKRACPFDELSVRFRVHLKIVLFRICTAPRIRNYGRG
jgi:hypothetical protein